MAKILRRPAAVRSRRGKRFLTWAALLVLAASVATLLELRWIPPSVSAFMVRDSAAAFLNGRTGYHLRYRWIEWEEMSPHLALAIIAAEDQRFFEHHGFDFDALRLAWRHNQSARSVRGGSTISQQTAKNLFLSPSQTYLRKGIEAYLAGLMELIWPKRRILEVYLNIAQFGDGVYGVAAASERFFRKSARRLSPAEAALLAAVLPNPVEFQVDRPTARVRFRQQWILRQMRYLGGTQFLRRRLDG